MNADRMGQESSGKDSAMRDEELRPAINRVTECVIGMAQCMNYLRATGLRVCLLVNFGTPKVQIKRIVNDF